MNSEIMKRYPERYYSVLYELEISVEVCFQAPVVQRADKSLV